MKLKQVIRDQAAAISKSLEGNPVSKESEKAVVKEEKEEKKETTDKDTK